jgi:uncharacterized protein
MNDSQQTFIGRVRSVTGGRISIQLDEKIYKSSMPIIDGILYRIGQIGSFVKIPLGYTHLYGVVTQAGAEAIPDSLKETLLKSDTQVNIDNRWLTVVLVGERVGNRFERGVAQYPTANDDVHLVTVSDLQIIYGDFQKESSITVGQISASESLPAQLDLDKLVTRHCAILGSTGSGKSNTVSVILEKISQSSNFKSQRILVIDPHGEYNDVLNEYCKVFKVNADLENSEAELFIPYWALPFDEFISIFSGHINDSQKDYIRQEIYKRKVAASKFLSNIPDENSITSDSPIPFSINQLWLDLDDFERQTFNKVKNAVSQAIELIVTDLVENGDANALKSNKYPAPTTVGPFINNQAKGILSFLDSVKNKLLNERFKFLFKPGGYTPDLTGKVTKDLDKLFAEWLGHDRAITILDLSGIPSEIVISISGTLLKVAYDCLFWGQNLDVGGRKQPLLIVLEEAHNYLKAGEDSISSRTVQTIAKEGRKYGVGLALITQRPSELDETVLSQCGSVITLRMTNGKDRGHISSVVQDDLQELVNLLPSLRTGEGLVIGEMVKIPSRVKFEKIGKSRKSSDPKVCEEWKREKPKVAEYEKVVNLWRSGKFK